jgi:hypothetical protein
VTLLHLSRNHRFFLVRFYDCPDHPLASPRSRLRVEPCGSIVFARTTEIGASRPLRRIPAIVSFLNPQPALSLVGGNRSSFPKAVPSGLVLEGPFDKLPGSGFLQSIPLGGPPSEVSAIRIRDEGRNVRAIRSRMGWSLFDWLARAWARLRATREPASIAPRPARDPAEMGDQRVREEDGRTGQSFKFRGNLLRWPVVRAARTFRVVVVEPKEYRPQDHAAIFHAAITALVSPEISRLDPYASGRQASSVPHSDLVTFPEAFLSQEALLSALHTIVQTAPPSLGCVHVGLRPTDASDGTHLFSDQQVRELLQRLSDVPGIKYSDLTVFEEWFCKRPEQGKPLNIGCVFTMDEQRQLRVCLHPKIVRSKMEMSPSPEEHMAEADLLSLITLLSGNKELLSVTLQPLLCSDALHLSTDRPRRWPLDGVNTEAGCFGDGAPDHVDIVSLATCTAQQERLMPKGGVFRSWHEEFLNSFKHAANELPRHSYSAFVFSNFHVFPGGTRPGAGGLSGIFLPASLNVAELPKYVAVSSWGRDQDNSINRWSPPEDGCERDDWSSLGCIASLDPAAVLAVPFAYILSFTMNRLLRDMPPWHKSKAALVEFRLQAATREDGSNKAVFREQKANG